jgi:hypothetical protein
LTDDELFGKGFGNVPRKELGMLRYLLVLVPVALVSGCGTMANVDGRSFAMLGPPDREPRPFGGVANDFRWVREQTERVVAPEDLGAVPLNVASACYFGVIDLPMSLIGDLLTLPALIQAGRADRLTSGGGAEPSAAPDREAGELATDPRAK